MGDGGSHGRGKGSDGAVKLSVATISSQRSLMHFDSSLIGYVAIVVDHGYERPRPRSLLLTQTGSMLRSRLNRPRYGTSNLAIFERQESSDRTASWRRHAVLDRRWMHSRLQHHPRCSLHRLSSDLDGLFARETHHDGAVGHGFEENTGKGGSRASEGRAGVKVLLWKETAASDGGEDGEEDGGILWL